MTPFAKRRLMDLLSVTSIAEYCQAAVMPICLTAYIPQWLTMIRNHSSLDVSLRAELLWALGSVFAVFYAGTQVMVRGTDLALLGSAVLNLGCLIVTMGLIIYYRKAKGGKCRKAMDAEEVSPLVLDNVTGDDLFLAGLVRRKIARGAPKAVLDEASR